jgi:hypothetical protein
MQVKYKCVQVIFFLFSLCKVSYAQHNVIYFSEFEIYLTPQRCTDTLKYFFNDSSYILIKLYDCDGVSSFVVYNNKRDIKVSGFYAKSLDTLKTYVPVYDFNGDVLRIEVLKYFEPLKEGNWYYYENRKLVRREKYKLGVKLNE